MSREGLFGFRRLTRRPIPWDDDTIEQLTPDAREVLAETWANRAQAELRVGARLILICRELLSLRANRHVLALATQAPGDEIRHAEICCRVASRYRGTDVPWPELEAASLPERPGLSPELRCALNVLGMCCISETIASAYLQACFSAAKAPLARAALGELLSDEIDHARLGWAHFASPQVPADIRTALGESLVHLLSAALGVWTTQNVCRLAAGLPEHGLLPTSEVRSIVLGSIETMVLPGLAEVGIDTHAATLWLMDASIAHGPDFAIHL